MCRAGSEPCGGKRLSLTALHRLDITSGNHPDILTAGVRRSLELIKTGAPGITAAVSINYQSDTTRYEFDLTTGTVARQFGVPHPGADVFVIVKAPDLGGDRVLYVAIVTEMQQLVRRVSGSLWDWLSTGGTSPRELRRASTYLQFVLEDVERAGAKTTAR